MTLQSVPLPADDRIYCAPLSALPDLLALTSLIGCLFSDTPPTQTLAMHALFLVMCSQLNPMQSMSKIALVLPLRSSSPPLTTRPSLVQILKPTDLNCLSVPTTASSQLTTVTSQLKAHPTHHKTLTYRHTHQTLTCIPPRRLTLNHDHPDPPFQPGRRQRIQRLLPPLHPKQKPPRHHHRRPHVLGGLQVHRLSPPPFSHLLHSPPSLLFPNFPI